MANNFFKFKLFTVQQDRCAMKVTTLACIQGAWLPKMSLERALDIGAGTGLLSLMMAQKYDCQIDAVEIEDGAYSQLAENIAKSPWADRIHCFHENIIKFTKKNSKQYDFIISNPPFFSNQLKSPDSQINMARHENELTIKTLIKSCIHLLQEDGKISIMLPPVETKQLAQICTKYSLFISNQLVISDSANKAPKAVVTILSKKSCKRVSKNLIIKSENGDYSDDFKELLKDYYLSL